MDKHYEEILKKGLLKVSEKKYDESKVFFEKLIKMNKERYEGYLNLSNIHVIQGDFVNANNLLKYYLLNIANNNEIVNAIAINLFNNKKNKELKNHIDLYLNEYSNHLLNYLKAYNLNFDNNSSDSIIFLKKSIKLKRDFWQSYELLFNIYDKKSMLTEMSKLLDDSKKIFLGSYELLYFEALYNYRNLNFKLCNKILNDEKLIIYITNLQNSKYQANYYDLLSKNNEKLLNFQKSLEYAIKRNKIIINNETKKGLEKKSLSDTINSYAIFFNNKNKLLFNSNTSGIEHSNLIFLIGFPRSGTTLLDSILRTHSNTIVLEEKSYLLDIRHDFYKNNKISKLLNLEDKSKIKMQEKYFSSFNYNSNKTIIDKFPLNLIELGFIRILFPNAKIILAIRHPLDCIISCVLTAFKINEAMLNFENLKTTSFFYNQVFSLLFKYIKFFNLKFHQVKYENIVLNFDDEIKKILNYLNLDFETNMKNFFETAKSRENINTPSYDQVTKPLYSNSINRHLNFQEIKKIATTVDYWVEYFDYEKINF